MRIFDILSRKSPSRIIKMFLENPTTDVQVKDIIKATKLAKLSVITWLKELVKSGVLGVSQAGRTRIYRLNTKKPVIKQLRILYNIDYINERIGKIGGNEQIFVYGSFARGENTERSDIDILVIGKNRGIIKNLRAADDRVKVSFYTPVEYSMEYRKDKIFFENVERDKIRLR